jgi:hypothetical protein
MRTAISENGRRVLEHRIQHWITLEEAKVETLHCVAVQLGVTEDEALDMLNVCANSRAALDRFGIEVYCDDEQKQEQTVAAESEAADDVFDVDVLEMWAARFVIACAVVSGVVGLICWLFA